MAILNIRAPSYNEWMFDPKKGRQILSGREGVQDMDLTGSGLLLVVLTGLMGASHCLVMCGGIVSSLALRTSSSPLASTLAYNAGRVTTYTVI